MQIKLETLSLVSFLCSDIEHYLFREELARDVKVKEYLRNIKGRLQELPEEVKALQDNASYIVKDDKKLIGYVHLESITKFRSLELHYAVHPNYRGNGYGVKLLKEVSNYILENKSDVETLQLSIHPRNKESRGCAVKAGYQYQKSNQIYYLKK